MEELANSTVIMALQYIDVSNQHNVHIKLCNVIYQLYLN